MAYAEISHSSFLHNLKAIKQFLPPSYQDPDHVQGKCLRPWFC